MGANISKTVPLPGNIDVPPDRNLAKVSHSKTPRVKTELETKALPAESIKNESTNFTMAQEPKQVNREAPVQPTAPVQPVAPIKLNPGKEIKPKTGQLEPIHKEPSDATNNQINLGLGSAVEKILEQASKFVINQRTKKRRSKSKKKANKHKSSISKSVTFSATSSKSRLQNQMSKLKTTLTKKARKSKNKFRSSISSNLSRSNSRRVRSRRSSSFSEREREIIREVVRIAINVMVFLAVGFLIRLLWRI